MPKTLEQLTFERDDLEVGGTIYGCRNCENLLDRVFFQDEIFWVCRSCDWNRDQVLSELDRVGIRAV